MIVRYSRSVSSLEKGSLKRLQEVIQMREWFLIALMVSLSFAGNVSAEEESDPFEEAGLSLVALRNDSLDSNQDGMMDAIRVVVVINSTNQWIDLTLTLIGEHSDLLFTKKH